VRPRARRPVRALGTVAALLVTVSGCGFANALAHPPTPDVVPDESLTSAAPSTSPPRTILDAPLVGGGRVVVLVEPVRTGLAPPVPNFAQDCPVSGPSLQYVAFHVVGVSGLAAHVRVSTGPTTPTGIEDVGVFVQSGNGDEHYCTDYPPLPTSDEFWNQMGASAISGWVVLDGAVTAATPQGRPDVFPTLQLRFSDFRVFSDPTRQQHVRPSTPTVGAICPDDARAICVSLG
jgi:hypothetical protein